MEPKRDMGLLPIAEHRRKRIRPLVIAGAIALVVGIVLDIGFVMGLGAGIIIVSGIALLADRHARSAAQG